MSVEDFDAMLLNTLIERSLFEYCEYSKDCAQFFAPKHLEDCETDSIIEFLKTRFILPSAVYENAKQVKLFKKLFPEISKDYYIENKSVLGRLKDNFNFMTKKAQGDLKSKLPSIREMLEEISRKNFQAPVRSSESNSEPAPTTENENQTAVVAVDPNMTQLVPARTDRTRKLNVLNFSDKSKDLISYYILNGTFKGYYLTNEFITNNIQFDSLETWANIAGDKLDAEKLIDGAMMFASNPQKGYFKGNGLNENLSEEVNGGWANWLLFAKTLSDVEDMDIDDFDKMISDRLFYEFCANFWASKFVGKMPENVSIKDYAKKCCILPDSIYLNDKLIQQLYLSFEVAADPTIDEKNPVSHEKFMTQLNSLKEFVKNKRKELGADEPENGTQPN